MNRARFLFNRAGVSRCLYFCLMAAIKLIGLGCAGELLFRYLSNSGALYKVGVICNYSGSLLISLGLALVTSSASFERIWTRIACRVVFSASASI